MASAGEWADWITRTRAALRLIVPLAALTAVVFGVTFFAQYSPRVEEEERNNASRSERSASSGEPPLRFFSSERRWDPPSEEAGYEGLYLLAPSAFAARDAYDRSQFNLQDRLFPGFFEARSEPRSASFWCENRHEKAVVLQLERVSCRACSGGRFAAIPPDVTRSMLQMQAVSSLPQGLVNLLPLGQAGPVARLGEFLQQPNNWQAYRFREAPHATFRVPPATNADGWSPQWGILELQFQVETLGAREPLQANFVSAVEGSGQYVSNTFTIHFEGVNAFEVSPTTLNIGELSETAPPRQYELIVYSSSRGYTADAAVAEALVPPHVDVRLPRGLPGSPGPFVRVGPPQPLSHDELQAFRRRLLAELKRPMRVMAAYRYPVLVQPDVDGQRIDIGQLVREIWFAAPGAAERVVRLTGIVRGQVWLDDNASEINLGAFPLLRGVGPQSVYVLTERPDIQLAEVESERSPRYLQVQLQRLPPAGDRGRYELKLRVPSRSEQPDVEAGRLSGVVVLEIQGPQPQRIRIPVRGEARIGR
ncbi:MAG: hypothetical protein NZU63_11040 [Gemmataceae bacterium]|nr:hypothetical protein [Gemmataceae bacterium]MDW8243623.1 hypothetical protein [Thermogemmata sp.]